MKLKMGIKDADGKCREVIQAILAAEVALEARERLIAKARARVDHHEALYVKQVAALHELKCKWREPNASDFRLRIVQDESRSFMSEREMLDEVFGDTWCDADDYHDDAECDARGGCEYSELAREYVAAWNGRGIYAWGGVLEQRNRVTGEWEDTGDGCFGFYSLDGCAPEDEIVDSIVTAEAKGCDIVYGEGD